MRKIFRRFAIFILVVCFYGLLPVQAQDKMNIAVIDFEAQGGLTPQEAAVLTNRLRSKLVTTDAFIMLDRGRMDEILKEQGFQLSGCTSTECAVEMGKLLNVQQIVSGSVGKIGSLYTIDIVLIDVETSQIIKSITRDFKGEIEGIIDLMGSIANELSTIGKPQITSKMSNLYRIDFSSVPSQAEVFLDNRFVGKTPVSNKFEEGSYLVRMHLENYIDYRQQISLQKDIQLEAKLKYTDEYHRQLAGMKKGKSGKRWLWIGSATAIIGGGIYYMTQIAPSQDKGFPNPPGRP
ncbi:MAG: PEGA domain-containing protein [Candidatus Marinimicrobia bacterium]|nr:PEGA domain-containing protein [Candidatus Neomarinimicrobiota bacterium]